jgi:hypothetical protein
MQPNVIARLKAVLFRGESVAGAWRSLARRLRFHAAPLAIVLAVSLGCQALVLLREPKVVTYPDTYGYIVAARTLLAGDLTPNPFRTPGYPLFLAGIFGLTRGENLTYVVIAQAALLIVGALEVYALAFILSGRRWIGALVGALVGGNLYLANWSRLILTEALTVWLMVSVMLCFAFYLRRATRGALALLVLLVLLVIAAMFTRPQLIYLPMILLAVLGVRALRQRRAISSLRRLWPVTASMAGAYALVLVYMVAFWATYGAFTTTQVSNINLLGMAMKYHTVYHMPYDGAEPQYNQLRADLEASGSDYNAFGFIITHRQYSGSGGRFYGAFASEVLRAHPGYVARGAYDSFVQTIAWDQIPSYPARIKTVTSWMLNISQDISLAYACLPLLLIASIVAAWRNPSSLRANMLAALMLVVVVHVAIGSIADFVDYPRLRMPVDWAMLTVTVLAIIQLVGSARAPRKNNNLAERPASLIIEVEAEGQAPTQKRRTTTPASARRS